MWINPKDIGLDREYRYDMNESLLSKPFEIYIDIDCEYSPEQEEEEIVDDLEYQLDDEEDPVAVSKPFKTDQCVVCLSKEPSVLFLECLHYCVCLECEETNPFRKCPSCRKSIKTKVMI